MIGKAHHPRSLRRASRKLKEFERLLIVCEGSKTEPNYFREICRYLGLGTASVEVIGDECDSAPINVFNYAKARFREDAGYANVYCVIDRDNHATFDAAVSHCKSHPSGRFRAICSFPCFEFWLLLHFRYTRSPIVAKGGDSPGDVVLRLVCSEMPKYRKGMKGVFDELEKRGLTPVAIANSRRARLDVEATGSSNPSTDVDELVVRLLTLASEQKI